MSSIKKLAKIHGFWICIILLSNILLVAELFIHSGKAAMLDSNAHILTIAQFYKALKDGELPVMWADGFANYGLPLGTISHQLPNYLGGIFTFFTQNPLISYYLLLLIAVVASSLGFYWLLSLFLVPSSAFMGTFAYTFATYRITNIFVRGAMPELFSTIWLPYILISLIYIKRNNKVSSYLLYAALLTLLVLTHPMSLILYSPFIFLSLALFFREDFKLWIKIILATSLALSLTAYYLIPLKLESKYLYMAANSNMYVYDQAVTATSLLESVPKYICSELNYIFWRCADIRFGFLETFLGLCVIIYLTYALIGRKKIFDIYTDNSNDKELKSKQNLKKALLWLSIIGVLTSLFMSSILSEFLYVNLPILGSIQIPSRFLSVYYFFFPILFSFLFEDFFGERRIELFFWCTVTALIMLIQFPLIYGKNYINIPQSNFWFTKENYHGLMLQPKWTLDSREYPVAREKGEIVKGRGEIANKVIKNASRKYTITAEENVTINDHTFYFPGWNVYVDGKPVNIEFQDPAYRGVITFNVPEGTHEVYVVYEDTKVRKLGKYITALSVFIFFAVLTVPSIYRKLKTRS